MAVPKFDLRTATDDQLVEAYLAGSSEAFAILYERYVNRVYDFVARLVGDREVAADVTQETFVKALTSLRARRFHGSLRAWLFTIARNTAVDHLRRQRTTTFSRLTTPEGEEWEPELPATGPEAEPEQAVQRAELAELVWQAARGLNPNDYALLDLSLRQDLTPAEVAQAVGARRGAINTRLSRLRDALEESFTVLLLARHGRQECSELDQLLGDVKLPAGLTPELRRTVARHVQQCDICQQNRRRVVTAAELLPALAPIMPSPELRAAMDATVQQALGAVPTSGVPTAVQQFRHWLIGTGTGKALLGTIAAIVVVVGAVGGWLAMGTAPVTAVTRGCPPLALELNGPAALVAGLLGVPAEFRQEQPARFRLPAGSFPVTVTREGAMFALAGVPMHIQFVAPLSAVTWDGIPLLDQGTRRLEVARGQEHTLELQCG